MVSKSSLDSFVARRYTVEYCRILSNQCCGSDDKEPTTGRTSDDIATFVDTRFGHVDAITRKRPEQPDNSALARFTPRS